MQPACGRRRCLALVAGLLVSAGVAQPAWARPGFPAKYAYARPMYLRGRLVSREDTLPYVRLTVDVPATARSHRRTVNGCGRWKMRRRVRR